MWEKLFKAGVEILEIVTGGIVLAIAAVLMLQVVGRYIIRYSYAWPEELAGFLFVWVIFLGAVLSHRAGGMLCMTYFRDKLPPFWQKVIEIFMNVLVMASLVLLVVKSCEVTGHNWNKKTTVLRFSWSWLYLALPIGFGLLFFSYLADTWQLLKTLKQPLSVYETASHKEDLS